MDTKNENKEEKNEVAKPEHKATTKKKSTTPKKVTETKSVAKEDKVENVEKASEEKVATATVKKTRKSKKKTSKSVVARGKRKESIARATIREGKGNIRMNKISINALSNKYIRDLICQPLSFVGPEVNSIDIDVSVFGGGAMGQAQAARTAIANALVHYFEGMNLKEKFIEVDRTFLIEDVRRVEPKKFRGPKARARYQKSYR